jgi:tetratricopeptide (TPR) repeat protein
MYLRTPKRYQKQRRQVVSRRFGRVILATAIVCGVGWLLFDRRAELAPAIERFIDTTVNQAQNQMATMSAPTPLPTTDPGERVARANQAWDRGAIEEALTEYQSLLDAAPNNALLHQRITLGLVMQGRADDAVTAAERAVNADPFNAESWALQAFALSRAGRGGEAITSALQSLSLEPENARALAYLSSTYFDLDRPDLAQQTISRALNADPNSYEANYVNALLQWQVDFALLNAVDSFETASAEAPNLPFISVDRAWLEWNLGNFETAEGLFSQVLELNPTNLDALYGIGFLYYQAYGDPNQSLSYLERCTAADPDNIACLNYLATVQSALGDQAGALGSYRRLMTTETRNPRHFLDAGRAYMNSGDCASALPVLREGYELQREAADNPDRQALFEEYLATCGSPVAAPLPEVTPEATEEVQ